MSPKPVGLAYCARPDCGHSVAAHFIRGCIVKGCSCKEFLAPGTLVTEVNPEKAAVYAEGWRRGYSYACKRYGHELGTYGDKIPASPFDHSEADRLAEPPAPLIRPYVQEAYEAPTIPTDLNGYLVIHAGDIKAGDTVHVYEAEFGALRLMPIREFGARSKFLQRIYDAIEQGWEDEFDTDCATGAVQDLLVELLQELDAYYSSGDQTLLDLASMVKEGRWIK